MSSATVKKTRGSELDEGTGMEAQGDEGTVRHRRKLVVLGTALPAASEARHSGHRLAPTGKGLPTRLPRSGLVQRMFWEIGPRPTMIVQVQPLSRVMLEATTAIRRSRTARTDRLLYP